METRNIYIAISIIALVLIAVLLFLKRKNIKHTLTPLAGLAFSFVIAGIIFGEERIIGYSLIGFGVLLSVIDIYKNKKVSRITK